MVSYINTQDKAFQEFTRLRKALWERIAVKKTKKVHWSSYYHRRLNKTYRFIIPPGSTVLEVGCGRGDLLAYMQPSVGVGIDFSEAMIGYGISK